LCHDFSTSLWYDFTGWLPNDIVSLVKVNGQRYGNIKSLVQPELVFISDSTLPIEEGDKIIRELPNGLTETYLVLDRGYYPTFHGMAAHYQVKVQKETAISASQINRSRTIIENLIAGDQINLSNIQQSAITIRSRMENIRQSFSSLSFGSDIEKNELQKLVNSLSDALKLVSPDREQDVTKILKRVEILLEEMNSEKPNKDKIEITSEGLIAAAKNLAAVTPIVLSIASQIVSVVNKIFP
jgi:hypothetical protein